MTFTSEWTSADATALHHEREAIRRQTFYDRLVWHYGPTRANAIMAGNDAATKADLAKWHALGGSVDGSPRTSTLHPVVKNTTQRRAR